MTIRTIHFRVLGIAAPQGSKTSGVTKDGRGFSREANPRTRPWRQAVAAEAELAMSTVAGFGLLEGPVSLAAVFYFPRPKSHFRTGRHAGELKPDAPTFVTAKPDLSKLVRAIEDSMSGIVFRDDSQIAQISVQKVYCVGIEVPHVAITVAEM